MARYNEYGLPKLTGTVSMTKIKNALKRGGYDLVPHLSNIRLNGQLRGCSGFLEDPATKRIVYINTEFSPELGNWGVANDALYRNARDLKDYTGLRNRFCERDADVLVKHVADLVASGDLT